MSQIPVPSSLESANINSGNLPSSDVSVNLPKDAQPAGILPPSEQGILMAKRRLRAFSIQKKQCTVTQPKELLSKPSGSTVIIGKLPSIAPKKVVITETEEVKVPRPPRLGTNQNSYITVQEQRLEALREIEEIKRRAELVELGIPLGLIQPQQTGKAMPTDKMPHIKTFLDTEKLNNFIKEAKTAKLEGKSIKFDYHKLLPDYKNPFQNRKRSINTDYDEFKGTPKSSSYSQKTSKSDKERIERARKKY